MRLQDWMVDLIEAARLGAFLMVSSVPEERWEWRPMDRGQSVLQMARELAKTPDWAFWVLTDARPSDPERATAEQQAEVGSWLSPADCEIACCAKLERLVDLYRNLPDARLAETKWLPFNGGRDHTLAELLDYPRWNFVYHTGQIEYVRLLFEDQRKALKDTVAFFGSLDDNTRRSSTWTSVATMRAQDYMIDVTREAHAEMFRYAKAVPRDKAEWRPLDAGRSVLDLSREIAQCPDWAYDLVVKGAMDWSEESQADQKAEVETWTTIEDCESAGKEKLERLFEAYRALSDERLSETMELPFGPEGSMKAFTILEIMDYPRWNANYHLGQIAYIQTLYGDKGMH